MGSLDTTRYYDVLVVGGGFSGLYQLHKCRQNSFKTHLLEAGSGLGGTWWHNCYPGARVDTEVPVYQYTNLLTFDDWQWSERYPGRDEIIAYFRHVDKVWNLSKDISYNSRLTAAEWDERNSEWVCAVVGEDGGTIRARFLSLCTGFASKIYRPNWKGLDTYEGKMYHTSQWPQEGLDLTGQRVAVIGTGATGVQVIQETARVAKHLTVFQRTPNTALPMGQSKVCEARNREIKVLFPNMAQKMRGSFAGFLYDFSPLASTEVTEEERRQFYESLFQTGGLHFWLGTYRDVLFDKTANDEAYRFWREKTLQRIKNPKVAALLAPEKALHPFGTKRVSLEQHYFEVFDQDNVTLIDLPNNPIDEVTPKGIKTADGVEHEVDVMVLATGYDSVSGGITQIDVRGLHGQTIKDKWSHGVHTNLGMTTHGFPNLFFTYGPQAPTAFATGPSSAEAQGDWILQCLNYLRTMGLKSIDPTRDAEDEWRRHVNDVAGKGLFPEARSWYFGDNIPGKPREALNYMDGMPQFKDRCWTSASRGYTGFVLA